MKKRPDISTHGKLVDDLRSKINQDAIYPLSDTDIVKIAIERFWKDAFPDRVLPQLGRKKYHELDF